MGGPEFDFEFNGRNFTLPVIPDAPSPPHAYGYTWINRHGGHGFGDMEMVELNKNLGRYFGTETGLLIVKAPADNAFTFQDGDVIKSIDGREPKDLHHAVRILSSYEGGETVNFEIMRDKRKQTITIEVPDDRRSFLVPRPAVAPTSVVIAPGLRVWREPDERT
jgi:S1-C subfamily serine protease